MSKRRELEGRIASLNEIHAIMESMKNLSMMETRKLARYYETQQRVVDSISHALDDVRHHYAAEALSIDAPQLYLLFGSERGFCGAYNEQLLALLAEQPGLEQAALIGVGSRLAASMQRAYPHALCLSGASVADEVEAVLAALVHSINQLRQERGALRLEVIHFHPGEPQPQCLPALRPLERVAPEAGLPPLINLPPQQLLSELLEHYLFAVTHAWLFAALMAENQRRVQHLEQAGHHLERRVDELGKRRNVLRQEEIIEEIEVILLSSEAVAAPGTGG